MSLDDLKRLVCQHIDLSWNKGRLALSERLHSKDFLRSEERRVGKECRSRWSPYH